MISLSLLDEILHIDTDGKTKECTWNLYDYIVQHVKTVIEL